MATRGWEVSRCFLDFKRNLKFFLLDKQHRIMEKKDIVAENAAPQLDIDLTDPEEARKAFIASEIFKKKY